MFKKGSYNVEKKSSTETKTSTMTLKKKAEIKNVSNKESPDYRKKSFPKKVTSTKQVENKTFKKQLEFLIQKIKMINAKRYTDVNFCQVC